MTNGRRRNGHVRIADFLDTRVPYVSATLAPVEVRILLDGELVYETTLNPAEVSLAQGAVPSAPEARAAD